MDGISVILGKSKLSPTIGQLQKDKSSKSFFSPLMGGVCSAVLLDDSLFGRQFESGCGEVGVSFRFGQSSSLVSQAISVDALATRSKQLVSFTFTSRR